VGMYPGVAVIGENPGDVGVVSRNVDALDPWVNGFELNWRFISVINLYFVYIPAGIVILISFHERNLNSSIPFNSPSSATSSLKLTL
jgi:hypothetical protein